MNNINKTIQKLVELLIIRWDDSLVDFVINEAICMVSGYWKLALVNDQA